MKERVTVYPDFITEGLWFFIPPKEYDEKGVRKKFKRENTVHFQNLIQAYKESNFTASSLENLLKGYLEENQLSFWSCNCQY